MKNFERFERVRDFEGTEYIVEDGPRTAYKVRSKGDEAMWFPADGLSPLRTDPRVEVVANELHSMDEDSAGKPMHPEQARRILAALDAMPSEKDKPAPARWIDSSGDTWEERPGGRLTMPAPDGGEFRSPAYTDQHREAVANLYGPLTYRAEERACLNTPRASTS